MVLYGSSCDNSQLTTLSGTQRACCGSPVRVRPGPPRNAVAPWTDTRQAGSVSATTAAGYHGFEFWVYDVCESILFAQMADVIAETPGSQRSDWLSALEQHLRVDAVAGADFYVPFDKWCDGHEKEFLAILAEAARRLAERGRITTEDATRWTVLDNHPIIWRGQEFEDTGPVVAFAEALTEIIHGEYPIRGLKAGAFGGSAGRRQ